MKDLTREMSKNGGSPATRSGSAEDGSSCIMFLGGLYSLCEVLELEL